jgi:hypothetical protein
MGVVFPTRSSVEIGPATGGFTADLDLTAVATTQYLSDVLSTENVESILLSCNVDVEGTTATTGKIKAIAIPYAQDGTTAIGAAFDLTAETVLQSADIICLFSMDRNGGAVSVNFGAVTATSNVLLAAHRLAIGIEITEANNAGTSAVANVIVQINGAITKR